MSAEATAVRIGNLERRLNALEKRNEILETSFKELVDLVRTSETSFTKKVLQAFSGVFHQLSDQLAATAQGPTAFDYDVEPVAEGTPQSIIVKRTGEQYDFSTSVTPDQIQNEGTEVLVEIFKRKELLKDGESGWFLLSAKHSDPQQVHTNGIRPTETGEPEVSA
ncbi:hypothetical protein MZD04_gp065 [Pseudomonas phage Psa21]|uniref:Uncharacterized protein n=1 Tax=Pseudomonas phage Psa21 TaxID=2530023 RepID=A0A481W5D1_9CAUD|nr:hypothetical protein MZD04_gp065 [Pseudomonas phage Psa21]QBJ02594.1 hypothetical protein PSA21_65 [Pseudomonas phage Psa21]